MTAVELWNIALIKIGVSKGIAALSDASREAWTGELVYDHLLRATLRDFPWPFATKYANPMTLVGGPVWDDDALVTVWSATDTYSIGDVVLHNDVLYYCIAESINNEPPNASFWETDPPENVNGDWLYSYRWPSDCLFARRIVPPNASGTGRVFDPKPVPFRIGRDLNGLLIYTNEPDAHLEYTTIDCTNLWVDDLWVDAFTWRLAAAAAPSLSRITNMDQKALLMYAAAIDRAAAVASKEQEQEPPGEAESIRVRS